MLLLGSVLSTGEPELCFKNSSFYCWLLLVLSKLESTQILPVWMTQGLALSETCKFIPGSWFLLRLFPLSAFLSHLALLVSDGISLNHPLLSHNPIYIKNLRQLHASQLFHAFSWIKLFIFIALWGWGRRGAAVTPL